MYFERSSGILLHITSLPSSFGIGDLGDTAYEFVDFLIMSEQKLWQVLPIGHTGFGDSPYQSFSAFAGNPLLISPYKLYKEGLLDKSDITDIPSFSEDYIEYEKVIHFKNKLHRKAFKNFKDAGIAIEQKKFENFCVRNKMWLDDYALYMALKDHFRGKEWTLWASDVAGRSKEAMERYGTLLKSEVELNKFIQYIFYCQWFELKDYANQNGVQIIGDIPIFVAYDSADVWANKNIFQLDEKGYPTSVAGVPPDFFSSSGQLWGNPLYRWDAMEADGYSWWIERFKSALKLYDILRIDHFRGFAAYWSVPYGESTAVNGRWVTGPGARIFDFVEKTLGKLPIIAEDLGVITPDVVALRDEFEFPGMNILQYAFSEADSPYLPHNNSRNSVIYTGTHDNDTMLGCFNAFTEEERKRALKYMNTDNGDESICWDFIRLAFSSPAVFAIIPLQDYLCLGSEGRMNRPGIVGNNWMWRYGEEALERSISEKIAEITRIYGRN